LELMALVEAHAPREPGAFWRYTAAAVMRHAPRELDQRQGYFADLRIMLRVLYATRCEMPDDAAVTRQIDDALALSEVLSTLPPYEL